MLDRSEKGRVVTRCAIYTRKSTEEGLDQEFNSLDAQREGCAAYITSQRHEGWILLPEFYDDGGFSGGHMDRPGLRHLLAEIEAGNVDVIVVYKVDRLTRSLADFAKIVEVLDAAGASFVSITQAFNTTTSMGRLTLNVLLSFAQFEREVISERVRDKIAASKRKGIWMGGPLPLGYDVVARKLVVNETEAETVRHILRAYLEIGTVVDLQDYLARTGIVSKVQLWSNGRSRGGAPFGRGALYHMLGNRLYRGQIRHHGNWFEGEHDAIIDDSLWEAVQRQLRENGVARRVRRNAADASLLAGCIRDGLGRRMTPSHASKGSVRYRYYVSATDGREPCKAAERVASGDIEPAVLAALADLFGDVPRLLDLFDIADGDAALSIAAAARAIKDQLSEAAPADLRALVLDLDVQVVVTIDLVTASVDQTALARHLGAEVCDRNSRVELRTTIAERRRGHEIRMSVLAARPQESRRDGRLIALLAKAHAARRQLIDATDHESDDEGTYSTKHLARMARLSFLAPDIVAGIMEGRQPPTLTARMLLKAGEVPLRWADQRRAFGFI